MRSLIIPGSVVCHDLVHVANVDHILGLTLVVGDAGVLKPVAPQDLVGKVARPHLENGNHQMENISQSFLACTVFPVSGVIPSNVTIISNCFLK